MKFSKETISILKNFGTINQGIAFKKGNVLKTVTSHKNILAEATIPETIPSDFCIYDLNNFLSVLSTHKDDVTFEFDSKHIIIVGNNSRSKLKYRFCEPTTIVVPPEKSVNMPNPEVKIPLTSDDFDWIMRVAAVLTSPHISVVSDGTKVKLVTCNLQDDSAHTDSLDLPVVNQGSKYNFIFKTENLTKILPGSYELEISSKGIAHFTNKDIKLQYWVTLETGSKYEQN